MEFTVADGHAGLKASIYEVLPKAAYQRCYEKEAMRKAA
jgi:transposase-like protein